MFIEKYQPYASLSLTYNGEEITENNPLTLPNVINGEYKVNLDAIGVSEDEREDLPFTRNDITWWLLDEENGVLTKEINVGDNAGSKFTIDDSGTLSIISIAFSAPENTSIEVVCVLGKPNSLNSSEFDQSIPNGNVILPFTCSGGGGDITFPTIIETNNVFTCDMTFTEIYAFYEVYESSYTIPAKNVTNGEPRAWSVLEYYGDSDFTDRVDGETYSPRIGDATAGFFAENGDFYGDDNIYHRYVVV